MKKIVIATSNEGKLQEFKQLFSQFDLNDIEFVTLKQVLGPDYEEPVEDGADFTANAYIKANHAAKLTGLPALADDSGLCVGVLNDRPGVHTARFAAECNYTNSEAKDRDELNRMCLLNELAPFRKEDPTPEAYFACALAFVRYSNDPSPVTSLGFCHGNILEKEVGTSGHGYDPLFFYPQAGVSFAQMPLEEKNLVSHRYQAFINWIKQAKELDLV